MTAPNNTIRFRQHWRGREPGQTTDALDYGVAQLLVQRGIAEFVANALPAAPPVMPGSFTPAKLSKGVRKL